jgi:hypothetical protein
VRVVLAVCAVGVSVDRFSNRLSIFNVMEGISSPSFPVWLSEISFIVVLRKENDEAANLRARCQVRIGDNIISDSEVAVDFGPNNDARQIVNFQGLPLPSPGDLVFRLLLPNDQEAAVTLPVVRVGEAVAVPAGPAGAA